MRVTLLLALLASTPRDPLNTLGGDLFDLNGPPTALLELPLTGDCECVTPSALTFTRSSPAACVTAAGVLTWCSANQARLTSGGMWAEGSAQNPALYNQQVDNAGWLKSGVNVTAANAIAAPDGTLTADRLQASAGSSVHWTFNSFNTTNGQPYSISVFGKAGTAGWLGLYNDGSPSARMAVNLSTCAVGTQTFGGTNYAVESLAEGWCRAMLSFVANASAHNIVVRIGRTEADVSNGSTWTADGSEYLYAWGMQSEPGARATSYVGEVLGTAVTRAAELPSVSNPLSGTTPSSWCLGATVTNSDSSWGGGGIRVIASVGTTYSAANSAMLYVINSGGVEADVFDSSGVTRYSATTGTLTSGAQRVVMSASSGAPVITVGGAVQSVSTGGAGTGAISSHPATIRLGNQNGTTGWLYGRIRALSIDNTAGGCQ